MMHLGRRPVGMTWGWLDGDHPGWHGNMFFFFGDSEIPTISVCLWCGPSNSGKWRFSSESPTKHVRILVVTVAGRGPHPMFATVSGRKLKARDDQMIWFDEFDDMQIVTAYGAEMEGLFQLFWGEGNPYQVWTGTLCFFFPVGMTSTGIGDSTAVSTKKAPWIIGFMIHHFRVESELLLYLKGVFHVTTYRYRYGWQRSWSTMDFTKDEYHMPLLMILNGACHPKRPLP